MPIKHKGIYLALGVALAAQAPLCAAIDATDLLTNSPFVHARIVPGQAGAGATGQQYVFRGVCKLGEDILVNVSDTVKKKTYWLKTGETQDDIKIVSYDAEAKKVSMLVGSRDYMLELAKPKVQTPQVTPAGEKKVTDDKSQPEVRRRFKRVRRPRVRPPAPPTLNFNGSNSPNNLISINAGTGGRNGNMLPNGSPNSGNNSIDDNSNNTLNEDEVNSSENIPSSPPSIVPPPPPNYIPELPENIRQMIESGAVPNSE